MEVVFTKHPMPISKAHTTGHWEPSDSHKTWTVCRQYNFGAPASSYIIRKRIVARSER